MREEAWRRSKSIEEEFTSSLNYIADLLTKIAKSCGGNQWKYEEKMRNFQNSMPFERFIYSSVKRMVTPLARGNYETWRRAARQQSKSRQIYRALLDEINSGLLQDIEAQVAWNASLIRTLPTDVAAKVVEDISKYTIEGARATSIAQLIRDKTDQHARASARLIARTEVSKTTTALTRARSENLGLEWYIWRTAQDGDRVRDSHQIMEDVLVRWSDPPHPEVLVGQKDVGAYHAGEIWNCRCYPEPLILVDDVKWPHKVYAEGRIVTMGKGKFLQMFQGAAGEAQGAV